MTVTNFLDDFLFVAPSSGQANELVRLFIHIATKIGLTVAEEKTEWASERMVFLGILILGDYHLISVPKEKRCKALFWAQQMSVKRKATIHDLQKFMGFLNFIGKAIYPGRAFTRRMYNKILWVDNKGNKMKQHYHVPLDTEFREDCKVWIRFLDSGKGVPTAVCRPFIDFSIELSAETLDFYTDSSAHQNLGFGGYFGKRWFAGVWNSQFI